MFGRIIASSQASQEFSETLPTPIQLGHTKLTRCTLLSCAAVLWQAWLSGFRRSKMRHGRWQRDVRCRDPNISVGGKGAHRLLLLLSTRCATVLRCVCAQNPCVCLDLLHVADVHVWARVSVCLWSLSRKVSVETFRAGASRCKPWLQSQQSPCTRQSRPPNSDLKGANAAVEQLAKPRLCAWICFPFAVCHAK